jgi:hypothetical protein
VNRKVRKKSRLLSIIVLAVLGCILMAMPVFAAGQGDGSGGGKDIALGLDSSIPSDGQKDVPLTGDIKLTFNKNVIFLEIRDANKTCFSLIASDGSKVPIEVIMADDQTTEGFEKRRDISVRPSQKLQPATAYVVKVSPQLQAKNGTSLSHEVTVNFVTAGVAPKPLEPAAVSDTGKNQADANQPPLTPTDTAAAITSESSHPVAENVQPAEKTEQQVEDKSASTKPEESEGKSRLPIALVAGAVIIVALGYAFYKLRNR